MSTIDLLAFTFTGMPRKPVPDADKKVAIGGRVAPSLLAAMQSLAEQDERTVSFLLEKAVTEYVQRRKPRKLPREKRE
jgi:hypothetical protein